MSSSKFNKRPIAKRRPPICIAPAGSCRQPYDRRRPPNLYGLVHWVDLDPLGPMHAGALIITGLRQPDGSYHGHIHFEGWTLGANISDSWPTPSVQVQIFYEDPFWGYQTHNFPAVAMPIDQPFNTRLLTTVFIPGTDYRDAWFNE